MCVLLKPVIDPASIQWDYQKLQFEYIKQAWNETDLHALQWACDYKEKHGGQITVLIAVDPGQDIRPQEMLKYNIDECLAVRFDHLPVYRNEVAWLLAGVLKDKSFDLILSGSLSEDTQAGTTPAVLAELLGIPFISGIHHIDPISERAWQVQRKAGRDRIETFEIRLPAMIGVTAAIARRRYVPRSAALSKSYKGTVRFVDGELGREPDIEVLRVTEPRPNIRYFTIPSSGLSAEKRLMENMGFTQANPTDKAGKIVGDASGETIRYVKEKIEKWLRGD